MSNLVLHSKENWLAIKEQALAVKQAGLLPTNLTAEQAAVIVLKGQELGIGTMRALEGLYVVNGKIGMSAALVMGLIRERCPHAKIVVKRKDDKGCVIEATRPGQEKEIFQFLEKDAQSAGLIKPGSPWQKYPASMYWSRCVTNMGRQLFSDVLGSPYTPEELGGEVEEEGNRENGTEIPLSHPHPRNNNPTKIQPEIRNPIEIEKNKQNPTEIKGAKVSSLNDRLQPPESTLAVTSQPKSKPETVNVQTGEVVEMPPFEKFEESPEAKEFYGKEDFSKELTHWDRLASSGPNAGKTLHQIFKEVGKEDFIKMYTVSTKKIAEMNSQGKEVPQQTLETYSDLELCVQEITEGGL